jgi:hypothetical protein
MSGVKSYKMSVLKVGCDENTPRQCKRCQTIKAIREFGVNGNGYYDHVCLECKRDRSKDHYQEEKAIGSDKYWIKRLSSIEQNAKQRSLSCNISIEDLKRVYEKQGGLCYYTGEQMRICSVDRIDCERGYQSDNIVMCERYINVFRGDMSILDFLRLCRKISQNHPRLQESELPEAYWKRVREEVGKVIDGVSGRGV